MSRKGFSRTQRLEGEIRAVLAEALLQDVKDPRLEGVVVSSVRLNRDGTTATVYFSVIGDKERERQAADGAPGGGRGQGADRRWRAGRTAAIPSQPKGELIP